jgi:hypothetical protein
VPAMSSFSAFALLLATIGLYGVISYEAGRRAKELGIRAAMGATRSPLVVTVVGEGMRRSLSVLCSASQAQFRSQLFSERSCFRPR